jgi:hypothetical protein
MYLANLSYKSCFLFAYYFVVVLICLLIFCSTPFLSRFACTSVLHLFSSPLLIFFFSLPFSVSLSLPPSLSLPSLILCRYLEYIKFLGLRLKTFSRNSKRRGKGRGRLRSAWSFPSRRCRIVLFVHCVLFVDCVLFMRRVYLSAATCVDSIPLSVYDDPSVTFFLIPIVLRDKSALYLLPVMLSISHSTLLPLFLFPHHAYLPLNTTPLDPSGRGHSTLDPARLCRVCRPHSSTAEIRCSGKDNIQGMYFTALCHLVLCSVVSPHWTLLCCTAHFIIMCVILWLRVVSCDGEAQNRL